MISLIKGRTKIWWLRTGYCGEYLNLRGIKLKEAEENGTI
jgi:hypothetical protein